MTIWRLLFQEIRHRRWSFLLGVLSVLVASSCLVAQLTVLRLHDAATDELLSRAETKTAERLRRVESETKAWLVSFEADTKQRLAEEEVATKKRLREQKDNYRKTTKKLGFNILIVSDREDIPLLDQRKFATHTMPEEYVQRLAKGKVVTIQHLLPMVQQEVDWPGLEFKVLVNGVRGEVPILHAAEKKPLMQAVPKGTVVLGYHVQKALGKNKGDNVEFRGRQFTVHDVHSYRKETDDFSVWMNLAEAQELLKRKGKINAILALECNCSAPDRLAEVRAEVKKILPGTEVLEFATKALVRAEARQLAEKEEKEALKQFKAKSVAALEQEKRQAEITLEREQSRNTKELAAVRSSRDELRRHIGAFAAFLIPIVLAGCVLWLVVLTLNNVRERQTEIGILRALGSRSALIFQLVVGRAALVGLVGAVLGYIVGILIGAAVWDLNELSVAGESSLFDPLLLAAALLGAPALCGIVGWLAALVAARQDPAVVLQQA
jgi:ABC-type lipoprotein release transport system permease subunit